MKDLQRTELLALNKQHAKELQKLADEQEITVKSAQMDFCVKHTNKITQLQSKLKKVQSEAIYKDARLEAMTSEKA